MSNYSRDYPNPSFNVNFNKIEPLKQKNEPKKKTWDEEFIAVVVISSAMSSIISTLITYFILK